MRLRGGEGCQTGNVVTARLPDMGEARTLKRSAFIVRCRGVVGYSPTEADLPRSAIPDSGHLRCGLIRYKSVGRL